MIVRKSLGAAIVLCLYVTASAQEINGGKRADRSSAAPVEYIIPGRGETSTLHHDGSQIEIDSEQRWRFMCGWTANPGTLAELTEIAETHLAAIENGQTTTGNPLRGAGVNINFNSNASVPAAALAALAVAEAYIETVFSDDIFVGIDVTFANLGNGILGATGSNFVGNVSYNASRNGLINGMDSDDVVQAWLPTGTTIPVRYNGNNQSITNESRIDWTRANYRSTVGTSSGRAASMTFNSSFNWDYDPSNGVGGTRTSFIDVVIHEAGHALGFVSAADSGAGGFMEAMDIFRFQRTDECCDYNPDTFEEFQTNPRLVDLDTPNDQHITDLIDFSHRMSDGSPWQASHLRLQNNAGVMIPALSSGVTRFPDYFSAVDLHIFDAIGYDYPFDAGCTPPTITQQPASEDICEGQTAVLTVATDAVAPTFQWRRGTTNLVDGGDISGVTTDTLTIINADAADDASDYNCVLTENACSVVSNSVAITVTAAPVIASQPPASVNVDEGGFTSIPVSLNNPFNFTYQWRQDGVGLVDDARISGSNGALLGIDPVELADAGDYDCVITSLFTGCSVTSNVSVMTVNPLVDCPGDLDGDLDVDLSDLAVLLSNFGTVAGALPEDGDLDGDGDVDLADLAVQLSNFGTICG